MSSFTQKLLRATFNLGNGQFFTGTNSDTMVLSGLRMSARITKAGAMAGSELSLTIYGMTISQMNDLCTLGMQIQFLSRNIVVLEAGDESGMSIVFQGQVKDAYADFGTMPDVGFIVSANSVAAASILSMEPTNIPSSAVNVPEIAKNIATAMGMDFESSVGAMTIPGPIYLWGSPRDQMNELAEQAHIGWGIIDNSILIWPMNGSRDTTDIPLVSPTSGMIKYPGYTQSGIIFETVFNPAIEFQKLVKVESALFSPTNPDGTVNSSFERGLAAGFFPANGIWTVSELNHYLDSKVVNGDWRSIVSCYNPKFSIPRIAPNVLQAP